MSYSRVEIPHMSKLKIDAVENNSSTIGARAEKCFVKLLEIFLFLIFLLFLRISCDQFFYL